MIHDNNDNEPIDNNKNNNDNNNTTTTTTTTTKTKYAHRHIANFLQLPMFLENNKNNTHDSNKIQILYDGSQLTKYNIDQNNISIHYPILVKDTPESIGMKMNLTISSNFQQTSYDSPNNSKNKKRYDNSNGSRRSFQQQTIGRRKRKNQSNNDDNDDDDEYYGTFSKVNVNVNNSKTSDYIRTICNLIGPSTEVNVIDVQLQKELDDWTFGQLCDYFDDEQRIMNVQRFYQLIQQQQQQQQQIQRQKQNPIDTTATTIRRRNIPRRKVSMKNELNASQIMLSMKVLNQVSYEFSNTILSKYISSPKFVHEIDWIDIVWPTKYRYHTNYTTVRKYPVIQYYCLTSGAGSYMDYHIDFGGTSVWYHVVSGEKEFCFIEPTNVTLQIYELWLCNPNQYTLFLPDYITEQIQLRKEQQQQQKLQKLQKQKELQQQQEESKEKSDMTNNITFIKHEQDVEYDNKDYDDDEEEIQLPTIIRVKLREKETMIIPSGWIHAVYTPIDSLVFGGNFLHGYDMKMQININNIEIRKHVLEKYRCPYFPISNIYASSFYYNKMRTGNITYREVHEIPFLLTELQYWWDQEQEQEKHKQDIIISPPQQQQPSEDVDNEDKKTKDVTSGNSNDDDDDNNLDEPTISNACSDVAKEHGFQNYNEFLIAIRKEYKRICEEGISRSKELCSTITPPKKPTSSQSNDNDNINDTNNNIISPTNDNYLKKDDCCSPKKEHSRPRKIKISIKKDNADQQSLLSSKSLGLLNKSNKKQNSTADTSYNKQLNNMKHIEKPRLPSLNIRIKKTKTETSVSAETASAVKSKVGSDTMISAQEEQGNNKNKIGANLKLDDDDEKSSMKLVKTIESTSSKTSVGYKAVTNDCQPLEATCNLDSHILHEKSIHRQEERLEKTLHSSPAAHTSTESQPLESSSSGDPNKPKWVLTIESMKNPLDGLNNNNAERSNMMGSKDAFKKSSDHVDDGEEVNPKPRQSVSTSADETGFRIKVLTKTMSNTSSPVASNSSVRRSGRRVKQKDFSEFIVLDDNNEQEAIDVGAGEDEWEPSKIDDTNPSKGGPTTTTKQQQKKELSSQLTQKRKGSDRGPSSSRINKKQSTTSARQRLLKKTDKW